MEDLIDGILWHKKKERQKSLAAHVNILLITKHIAFLVKKFNQKEFECFDIKYKWFSFEEFQKDERIQKVNSDIIQFVKSFDV